MLEIKYNDDELFLWLSLPLDIVVTTEECEFGFRIKKFGGFYFYLFRCMSFCFSIHVDIDGNLPCFIRLGFSEIRLHSPKDWIALARLILNL